VAEAICNCRTSSGWSVATFKRSVLCNLF